MSNYDGMQKRAMTLYNQIENMYFGRGKVWRVGRKWRENCLEKYGVREKTEHSNNGEFYSNPSIYCIPDTCHLDEYEK